ncbi:MAG TPA: hypothetical protein DCE41_10445 [Cytophagales bacterium]|nr:hypothetical protein [Cytophagales bacterium]HAA19320.1 hypothetical protein [Cytophagales bacterium]HAP61293.1 hypothetical protein [Cytophagales bacterium]
MTGWKMLISFAHPHGAAILKSQLDAAGIPYQMQDGETVQMVPVYSDAVGGVKLWVREEDYPEAWFIAQHGPRHTADTSRTPSLTFDSLWDRIPLINRLPDSLRIWAFLAALVVVLVPILMYGLLPSRMEVLTKEEWCVQDVWQLGQPVEWNCTNGQLTMMTKPCQALLRFHANGQVTIDCSKEHGLEYALKGKQLTIQPSSDKPLQAVESLLVGTYDLQLRGERVRLKSASLELEGQQHVLRIPSLIW